MVGVNKYTSDKFKSKFGDLKCAVHDAEAVRDTLKKEGVKVFYAENCDVDEFERKFKKFESELREGDAAIFYFAGHGLKYGNVQRLVMSSGSSNDFHLTRDSVGLLVKMIRINKRVGTSLAIVDCCRQFFFKDITAGSIPSLGTRKTTENQEKKDLPPLQRVNGTLIAYACAPNHCANESEETHHGRKPHSCCAYGRCTGSIHHTLVHTCELMFSKWQRKLTKCALYCDMLSARCLYGYSTAAPNEARYGNSPGVSHDWREAF